MPTWSFTRADTLENTVEELIKTVSWMMAKLDSKNVKRIDTNETFVKSATGSTYINGPILEMNDVTPIRRLNMGLDESTDEFKFELYDESGSKTVSIDSNGNGVLNQITLRNDLTGSAYIQMNTSGLIAYNGTVNTVEIDTNGDATFKQVTLRNDLTGSAYVQINTSGLIANNGSVNTVEVDTNGDATFKQVTLRNDLTGSAYVQINTSGFIANNGSVNTVEIDTNGAATFKQVTLRNDMTGSNYISVDTSGIFAWDNALALKTFEIDSNGKAYFRGDITSDATITGSTLRSAAVGNDRIEISGGKFEGITAAGNTQGIHFDMNLSGPSYLSDVKLYHNGTNLLEFYDNITSYTIRGSSSSSGLVIGATIATTYPEGTWDFNSTTINNLSTDTEPDHDHTGNTGSFGGHDHGIPNGTVLMVNGGGTVTFASEANHYHSISNDGSHSHSVV